MINEEKEPTEQSLKIAFEQNWLHARHLENERLWFTNIYAIIVAGILVVLGSLGFDKFSQFFYLILFLDILSILGIIVVIKTNAEFSNHMTAIKKIIDKLNLGKFMGFPYAYQNIWIYKIIRVRYAFIGFYVSMIVIWTYLLIISIDC